MSGFVGHWSSLPVVIACSGGRERRYCCDPQAWDNIADDFGQRAFGQGGYLDWFGEPLCPLLCGQAVEHGLDPHALFAHPELNYKPHKAWWAEHVRAVAARMATASTAIS